MKRILIVSTEANSGKSVLALSIGRWLESKDIAFSYMKPISYEVTYTSGAPLDRDAMAIRSLLHLEDDLADIAPVPLEGPFLREAIESGDRGFRQRITSSFQKLCSGREVALIEGRHYLGLGLGAGLSDFDLAELLNADIVLLTRFDSEEAIDRILCAVRLLLPESNLLGVVLKEVALNAQLEVVNEVFVPFLADRGAEVLGILPYDVRLRSVRVQEIATRLSASALTNVAMDRTVSHFVIGASSPETASRQFRRTPELGVITSGDRSDLHEAALRVPGLRLLVLTENRRPPQSTIDAAHHRGVPVLLAGQTTLAAASLCQSLLDRTWIKPGEILEYATELFLSNVDIERLVEKAIDR